MDEMLREKYKREFEEFQEKERLNKWNLRQVQSLMAEQSIKDSQLKHEREVTLIELISIIWIK